MIRSGGGIGRWLYRVAGLRVAGVEAEVGVVGAGMGRRSEEYIASMVTTATIIVVMCGHLRNVQFSEKLRKCGNPSPSPLPPLSVYEAIIYCFMGI